jgi:hypothetical protein
MPGIPSGRAPTPGQSLLVSAVYALQRLGTPEEALSYLQGIAPGLSPIQLSLLVTQARQMTESISEYLSIGGEALALPEPGQAADRTTGPGFAYVLWTPPSTTGASPKTLRVDYSGGESYAELLLSAEDVADSLIVNGTGAGGVQMTQEDLNNSLFTLQGVFNA